MFTIAAVYVGKFWKNSLGTVFEAHNEHLPKSFLDRWTDKFILFGKISSGRKQENVV